MIHCKPTVSDFIVANGFEKEELIRLAASLERASEHPLAQSVIDFAKDAQIELVHVDNFEVVVGKGVQAEIEKHDVLIGSEHFLDERGISIKHMKEKANTMRNDAKGVIFMAVDGEFSALIAIEDPVKETSVEAVKNLENEGMTVVMLSGDNEFTANAVAKKLGINKVYVFFRFYL